MKSWECLNWTNLLVKVLALFLKVMENWIFNGGNRMLIQRKMLVWNKVLRYRTEQVAYREQVTSKQTIARKTCKKKFDKTQKI